MTWADAPTGVPVRVLVDASALLCRYLSDGRGVRIEQLMESADRVVVTALARPEVELGVHQAIGGPVTGDTGHPTARLIADWDRFWVLPVDNRCLRRAGDLGRIYGLNLVNALHLAAFDRVPRPATLVTVDDRQLAAAHDLGFDVAEIDIEHGSAHRLLRQERPS